MSRRVLIVWCRISVAYACAINRKKGTIDGEHTVVKSFCIVCPQHEIYFILVDLLGLVLFLVIVWLADDIIV